jgi:hypothetical protein
MLLETGRSSATKRPVREEGGGEDVVRRAHGTGCFILAAATIDEMHDRSPLAPDY